MNIAVIAVSPQGITIAEQLKAEWQEQLTIFSTHQHSSVESIRNIKEHVDAHFGDYSAWVFIGAMGICIRTIAEHVQHKYHDPAVINIDSTGRFVVSVLSGHVGGANELTEHIASLLGAQAVVSTQTDNTGLWALDLFSRKYGWAQVNNMGGLNKPIALYTNGKPTALLDRKSVV